jgi:chromosome segregation ATPase
MNARKRPAEPRSRGHSPVEKRSRGPQVASPPRSRTGSRAGLPENVSAGPARKATEVDPAVKRVTSNISKELDDRRGSLGYSPLHMHSPRSGSEASTPVHTAPVAPSMLPRASSDAAPVSMSILNRARQRKQACLDATKRQGDNTDSVLLRRELKAQEERNLQLLKKIKVYEDTIQEVLGRVVSLENKTDLIERVAEMEKASKSSTERVSKAEFDEAVEKINKKIDSEKVTIITLSTGFNNLDTKTKEIQKTVSDLSDSTDGIQKKTDSKIDNLSQKIEGLEGNDRSTYNKATRNADSIEALRVNVDHIKKDVAKNTTSITNLKDDVSDINVDGYIANINIEIAEMKTVVGQVKNFQSELGKLKGGHTRLTSGQDTLSTELKALKVRLDVVEKKGTGPGPGFVKAGTPVTKSSAETTQANANAAAQLKQFEDDIKMLQTSAKESKAAALVATQLMDMFNDNIKALKSSVDEAPTVLQINQINDRLEPLEQLPEKIDALQTAKIDERLKALEQLPERVNLHYTQMSKRLEPLEQLPEKIDALTTKLGEDLASLADRMTEANPTATTSQTSHPQPSDLAIQGDSESSLEAVEDSISELQGAVVELQQRVFQEHQITIEVLKEEVPKMLTQIFEPFKSQVNKDRQDTNNKLESMGQDIIALHQRPVNAQATVIEGLRQAISSLEQIQQNLRTEMSQCTQDVSSLKQQLLGKADANAIDEPMNNFRHSFRVLQDQYNNLTSDELHGKMVNWILQNYPTSTATMQQQYASLLQEIRGVHDMYAPLAWLPPRTQDLVALLENGLQHPQVPAHASAERINQILETANQAMVKAGAIETTMNSNSVAIQNLQTALTSVQQSLNNLNSAPFVRASVTEELRKTIDSLVNQINGSQSAVEELQSRFTGLHNSSSTLRQEHDRLMQDFIDPNRENLAMFGQLLELAGQLQVFAESVYMNYPTKNGKSPLERPLWLPLENGDGSHKDKGKGKQ